MTTGRTGAIGRVVARRGTFIGRCGHACWCHLVIFATVPVLLYSLMINPISAGEDDVGYYYPLRKMTGEALAQGRLPLGNPLEATGGAVIGDPQSAVMFPATWLFAIMPPLVAYTLSIYVGFWLGGAGGFVYLRSLGLCRVSALFGSIAFMFGGFMIGHRVHLAMIHSAAFLPWLLWGVELAKRCSGLLGGVVVLAPAMCGAMWAGHYPTVIHMTIIVGAYVIIRAGSKARVYAAIGIAGCVTVALSMWQIESTLRVMNEATRGNVGYFVAGENSFFPTSIVLALFPLIQGVRTQGIWGEWWGSWHLCEMLPYVGLGTLVLAGAAIRRIYRADALDEHRPIVRCWTWISAGAFIWMLGYYLPTYRLIHMLPVVGAVRCPARMILAVNMGLAVLASVAVDKVVRGRRDFAPTLRRGVTRILPAVMLLSLVALLAVVLVLGVLGQMEDANHLFSGSYRVAMRAMLPWKPAVFVPLGVLVAWMVILPRWARRSSAWASAGICTLLLVDLFIVARAVDVPGKVVRPAEMSPAAKWLHENEHGDYRVWGLAEGYLHRPDELLLPKTCCSMGIASIASYGPFQSPAHAWLMGFDNAGKNHQWRWLVHTNRLLSLYGVRYLLVEDGSVHQRVVQSVTLGQEPFKTVGQNLLTGDWHLTRSTREADIVRMRAPIIYLPSSAASAVMLEGDCFYRLSFNARSPGNRADGWLIAKVASKPDEVEGDTSIFVPPEQLTATYRRFETIFRTRASVVGKHLVELSAVSEETIEVKDIQLIRCNGWWSVETIAPDSDDPVYRQVAVVPALNEQDPPIRIFENSLVHPVVIENTDAFVVSSPEDIECFKWDTGESTLLPKVGIRPDAGPTRRAVLAGSVGVVLYITMVSAFALAHLRRRRAVSSAREYQGA